MPPPQTDCCEPRLRTHRGARPATAPLLAVLALLTTPAPPPMHAFASASGVALLPAALVAQEPSDYLGERTGGRGLILDEPLLAVDVPYVLVHLATNRVHLMDGVRSIWSAPAATGNGFRLAGAGKRWTFTTPKGLFRVRRKEKDPIWVAPDWYFVERGLRVPADNAPSRRIPGAMGNTAIYLGDGIAIHGTTAPALVLNPDPERRRVSHGCIRLTNESARELYHLVEVGTPVLVY